MTHSKVQHASVVGLPDPLKGEVPVAAVELRQGEVARAQELHESCRGHIASYQIPAGMVVLRADEFLRTSMGKVHKPE